MKHAAGNRTTEFATHVVFTVFEAPTMPDGRRREIASTEAAWRTIAAKHITHSAWLTVD